MINVQVGEVVKRKALHKKYGGQEQGGISSAPRSNAVFLFADPKRAKKHGYVDGWGDDERYHYCGQGREGDQAVTSNNKVLLNHAALGRSVYLFEVVSQGVRLIGEFAVDEDLPLYFRDGLDENKELRQMIVFRLVPKSGDIAKLAAPPTPPEFLPATTPTCEYTPIEKHLTGTFTVSTDQAPRTARRREADLVRDYVKHLETMGHQVSRHRIFPSGEAQPLRTDVYDHTDNVLTEAKGDTARPSVRMAVGQLLDYRRHIKPAPKLAALFPVSPRADLRDFCATLNIATIWQNGKSFETSEPPGWAKQS
jgi:hypothetical protein